VVSHSEAGPSLTSGRFLVSAPRSIGLVLSPSRHRLCVARRSSVRDTGSTMSDTVRLEIKLPLQDRAELERLAGALDVSVSWLLRHGAKKVLAERGALLAALGGSTMEAA
jgi:hypothetical protein